MYQKSFCDFKIKKIDLYLILDKLLCTIFKSFFETRCKTMLNLNNRK